MNKKHLLLIVTIVLLIGALILFLSLWSSRDRAIELQETIAGQYVANKSNYDKMWKSFKEMTQVTDIQAEHVKDIYDGIMSKRYDDTNLLVKAVQEANPDMDKGLYTKLQNEISAGRTEFDRNQKKVADMITQYNIYIRKNSLAASLFGFDKYNADDYVVTSGRTTNAFDIGEDEEINLR